MFDELSVEWLITNKDENPYEIAYGKYIKNATRNYWNGNFSRTDFMDVMTDNITLGLRKAFKEGMSSMGISMDEVKPEETDLLNEWISNELNYLDGYADFIQKNNKESGRKFSFFNNRIRLWSGRYPDVVIRARLLAKNDPKLKWEMSPEKEHCESCLKLNGKVKRASYWNKMGLRPKSLLLDCSIGCGCDLVQTTEPLTRGRLPKI